MPSSHLILCRPLLLLPPIPPSIRVFSNESTLRMRWPKYQSFSLSISPSNEYPGWSPLGWTGWISLQSKGLQEASSAPQFEGINSLAFCLLYSPVLTTIHDHWEDCSLPGSSVRGVFQSRTQQWIAISFSRESAWLRNWAYISWSSRRILYTEPLGKSMYQFSSVQSLSRVRLFVTPWIAARQASLSITNFRSSLKLTSNESGMPSSHLILCHPLLLLPPIPPSIRVFSNESTLHMRCPNTGVSASVSLLPKKSQGWSPSEWTGWISLQSKGLSRVFSNTTVQKHQFFGAQLSSQSNSHIHTWPLEKP